MAKNKKGVVLQFQPISLERYVKDHGRKLELGKAFTVSFSGLKSQIIINRLKKNGTILAGFYLIDRGCLGLKDTFMREFSSYEDFLEMMDENLEGMDLMSEIDPTLAQNIIYGAIEWAEDAGFKPHKDFKFTEYLLQNAEDIDFVDVEFGLNGRYYYESGPEDSVPSILNTLEKNIGIGNFEYSDEDFYEDVDDNEILEDSAFFRHYKDIAKVDLELSKLDLESRIIEARKSEDLTRLSSLILYSIADLVENQIIDNPDFEDTYKENPAKIIEELDQLIKNDFGGDLHLILPLETIVLNTVIYNSACWALLPQVTKFLSEVNEPDNSGDLMDFIDFMATAKDRVLSYFLLFAMSYANKNHYSFVLQSKDQRLNEKHIKEAAKVFFESIDNQNEDLVEYPGYYDLIDVLEVYKVEDKEALLRIYNESLNK